MEGDVIIRKQKLRITAPTEQIAFECRRFLNHDLNTDLTKMYEQLFFQSTVSEEYLIIDSLKVDLGVLSISDFKNHLYELLEEKLINELNKQLKTVSVANISEEDLENKPETEARPDPIVYSTETRQSREALLEFLRSGNFPWWYKQKNGKAPAEILDTFTNKEQESFLLALVTDARRLPVEKVTQMVKRLFIHLKESVYETYLYELSKLFSETSLVSTTQIIINQRLSITKLFNISLRDLYEQAVAYLLLKNEETDFFRKFLAYLQESFAVTTDELHQRLTTDDLNDVLAVFDSQFMNKAINNEQTGNHHQTSDTKQKKPLETTNDGIYILNSGLVILHPFLTTFFKSLDLLDKDNQFTSTKTQAKATVLLYYLQCGMTGYKEWEMSLNKVLCGMGTEELLPDGITLSDSEKEESHSLLQSVIEYWTALKGASIEALQTTFFLRTGKISFKENHLLIQVERTGVDILVDRLPWGVGTIKLPWIKEVIYVEW
jgi:hypothetical protein